MRPGYWPILLPIFMTSVYCYSGLPRHNPINSHIMFTMKTNPLLPIENIELGDHLHRQRFHIGLDEQLPSQHLKEGLLGGLIFAVSIIPIHLPYILYSNLAFAWVTGKSLLLREQA